MQEFCLQTAPSLALTFYVNLHHILLRMLETQLPNDLFHPKRTAIAHSHPNTCVLLIYVVYAHTICDNCFISEGKNGNITSHSTAHYISVKCLHSCYTMRHLEKLSIAAVCILKHVKTQCVFFQFPNGTKVKGTTTPSLHLC